MPSLLPENTPSALLATRTFGKPEIFMLVLVHEFIFHIQQTLSNKSGAKKFLKSKYMRFADSPHVTCLNASIVFLYSSSSII